MEKEGNQWVQFGVAATYLKHRFNYTSVANGTKNLPTSRRYVGRYKTSQSHD